VHVEEKSRAQVVPFGKCGAITKCLRNVAIDERRALHELRRLYHTGRAGRARQERSFDGVGKRGDRLDIRVAPDPHLCRQCLVPSYAPGRRPPYPPTSEPPLSPPRLDKDSRKGNPIRSCCLMTRLPALGEQLLRGQPSAACNVQNRAQPQRFRNSFCPVVIPPPAIG
jgi:hypothetical protein